MQPRSLDFAAVLARAEAVPGWLTPDQARCLYDAAAALASGDRAVEIGSHLGRSAVVLASALPAGSVLTCVDPFPADWRYGRADTENAFRATVHDAGLADRVDLRVAHSREVRAGWGGPVHLVYVDGKHDYWSVRDDLRWADHLVEGGTLLVHDAYSSLGVTTGLLAELATSDRLRYVRRVRSLAVLQRRRPSVGDRLRLLVGLPWFARNLVVKVLLRARARRVAALLGHRDVHDPY